MPTVFALSKLSIVLFRPNITIMSLTIFFLCDVLHTLSSLFSLHIWHLIFFQAQCFSLGSSTTEQCLRLSQLISAGFQSSQRQRTIATFFDFSLSYDCAWRMVLVLIMSKIGFPRRYTEWLSSRFINRTARVRVNGSISPFRTLKVRLPLGPSFPTFCHNLPKSAELRRIPLLVPMLMNCW